MDLVGFWSYVHKDDETSFSRVTQLGRDIVDHYASITADDIELFLDRDDLSWGDKWRSKVDDALSNVAFFIPVITPRYFKSTECRREFQLFVSKASSLGLTKLVMPILYIPVAELLEDEPVDDLMRIVKEIHWEDWSALRFAERSSGDYQQGVHRLALILKGRMEEVARVDVAAVVETRTAGEPGDEEAGALDRMAAFEEAMPRWVENLNVITNEIEAIGSMMSAATEDIEAGEKAGKGFAARLTVARRVSNELAGPVDRIVEAGSDFATNLSDIDAGVRVIIDEAVNEGLDMNDPENVELDAFFASMRGLAMTARGGLGSIAGMVQSAQPLERMSKDMRPPLRRLRQALTSMQQAQQITDAWIVQLDKHRLGLSMAGLALADEWSDGGDEADGTDA